MKKPDFSGLIQIGEHQIYAEYKQAVDGSPTFVLLNGLSEDISYWDAWIEGLQDDRYGILQFDFRGQGKSLEWELTEKGCFTSEVTVREQAEDLRYLLDHFGVTRKVHLIGFSYGGGVALDLASTWPYRVDQVILTVPYVIRLDRAFPMQRLWAHQMEWLRSNAWPGRAIVHDAFSSCENWYRQFLQNYMHHRYRRVVPDEAIRSASILLTFGILGFNGFEVLPSLPERSIHLVTVGRDTLVPRSLYGEFWSRLPESKKGSWLYVEDGEHLLMRQYPRLCARWCEAIIRGEEGLRAGRKYRGRGYSFEVFDDCHEPLRSIYA